MTDRPGFDFEAAASELCDTWGLRKGEMRRALEEAYDAGKLQGGLTPEAKNLIEAALAWQEHRRHIEDCEIGDATFVHGKDQVLARAARAYRGTQPKPPRYTLRQHNGRWQILDRGLALLTEEACARLNAAEKPA